MFLSENSMMVSLFRFFLHLFTPYLATISMALGLAFLVVVEKSFDKVLTKKQLENETENLLHSFLPFLIIKRDKEIS